MLTVDPFEPRKILKMPVVTHRDEAHLGHIYRVTLALASRAYDRSAPEERGLCQTAALATRALVPTREPEERHGEVGIGQLAANNRPSVIGRKSEMRNTEKPFEAPLPYDELIDVDWAIAWVAILPLEPVIESTRDDRRAIREDDSRPDTKGSNYL